MDFDPYQDEILSIMTQRSFGEDLSVVENFWSQADKDSRSQSTLIPDEINDESEDSTDEEENSVVTSKATDLHQYHNVVDQSVVDILVEGSDFDSLTQQCSSPLYELLVDAGTKLDDLNVGAKSDKTYTTTYTAIRSFNFFWLHHNFSQATEPSLHAIKHKFGDMVDGFQAICSATHHERNILLAHYVSKMMKRTDSRTGEVNFVLGKTKRGYLNSLMRAMKLYENQHKLKHVYGEWSWSKSDEYEQTRTALKRVTTNQEVQISPAKLSKAAAHIEEDELAVLHDYTWELSEDQSIPFSERLKHKQAYFMQGLCKFECLRARDELALCLVSEFTKIDDSSLLFQMKRDFKSCKLLPDMSVVHKESLILKGQRYVEIFNVLCSSRPTNIPEHHSLRLFLKPKPSAKPCDDFIWSAMVQGKTFCSNIVSFYAQKLQENHHPLFQNNKKLTNSSLRKFHSERLKEARAPLVIQQQSLAQNTRYYVRGAHNLDTKRKVADIIAGERKSWDSPSTSLPKTIQLVHSPNATKTAEHVDRPKLSITNQPSQHQKKLRFSFKSANANIEFDYDV